MTGAGRVVVVGAGIAGVACARVLANAGLDVVVRERARGAGGRLASQRLDGRVADTGGQYATASDPDFARQVRDWESRGLIRPWSDGFHSWQDGVLAEPHAGATRWAAPQGVRSLVLDLAADLVVDAEAPVSSVGPGPSVDGVAVDAVVLAMPDPQAAAVLDERMTAERAAVTGRRWEPVLALQARWPERGWGIQGVFVNGDPVLSWIADDGARRGDGAPVLVAHSTGEFAAARLAEPAAAQPELVDAVRRVLGVAAPEAARVQRWTYARPAEPREDSFYLGAAGVGLCGDGWGSPKVETAWVSGHRLGHALVECLA